MAEQQPSDEKIASNDALTGEGVDGPGAVGAASKAGARLAREKESELARKRGTAWQRAADDHSEAGSGVAKVVGLLLRFLAIPFQIVAGVAQRLMSKVTGEDLAAKVRESKRELKDLDESHAHMQNKFGERIRDQQQAMSRMHMEKEHLLNDRDRVHAGKDHRVTREADEEVSNADAAALAGFLPSGKGRGSAKTLGLLDTPPGQEGSRESFVNVMRNMLDQMDPAVISSDLVSYEKWAEWAKQEGIESGDILAAARKEFGESWKSRIDAAGMSGSVDSIRKCVGSLFEAQLTGQGSQLLQAAKISKDAFENTLLRQVAVICVIADQAGAQEKAEWMVGAVLSGKDTSAPLSHNEMDDIDRRISLWGGELKEDLRAWQSLTDRSRGLEVKPVYDGYERGEVAVLATTVTSNRYDDSQSPADEGVDQQALDQAGASYTRASDEPDPASSAGPSGF